MIFNWVSTLAILAGASFSGIAHVVDGDTIRVGDVRVRLSAIDAPELSQRCGAEGQKVPCGASAAAWLRARIEGRNLQCIAVDTDRYGRIVATCRDHRGDLGSALVRAGWATAYRRYGLDYVADEAVARKAHLGIWVSTFEQPSEYRAARREADGTPPLDPACPIKGNVNTKGARIYHTPGSRDYPAVRIDAAKGERWFCSISEAEHAGWRPVQ